MTSLPPDATVKGPTEPGLARSASIVALGNVGSRVLGLVRETVIADVFGAAGTVSAFRLAATVPTMLYDLLIGGLLSAALVPVMSALAVSHRREEFGRAGGALLGVVAVGGAALVLLLELSAPLVIRLLGGGFDAELQTVAIRSLRILAPAVWFVLCSGVVTGLLYARQRFTYPAIAASVFNLGIVLIVPLLSGRLDIYSLAWGLLLGSALQLLVQLPGLRKSGLRISLDFRHPAFIRVAQLYVPIVLGLIVTQFQIGVDRNLASRTGESSIAWMQNATTLVQFPLGLVAVAVALASLPSLSRFSAVHDWDGYRRTLGRGLKLVLLFVLPATVGLGVLGVPLIRLIFEHGAFGPTDTYWTSRALIFYLIGLPFAAVDWPLNYAFYAQQDTRTPALVGVASVGVYLLVALPLVGSWGMLGLVLADSAKQASHAVIMLALLRRRLGHLGGQGVIRTGALTALAAGAMGAVVWWVIPLLQRLWPSAGLIHEVSVVAVGAGLGVSLYLLLVTLLRIEEMRLVWQKVGGRLRRAGGEGEG